MRIHPTQLEFRKSTELYRGFVGGRGAGKTWIGAYDLIFRAKRNRTYLIASPTGVLLNDTTFPTFRDRAKDLGVWGEVRMTPYPTVQLTTGATVRFRTAEDPERMRGPNLSGVWLDEASLMPEEAYSIAIASLREGGEQGWLSATFTPKGPYHWTYETFAKGRPNTAIFRSRTGQNPFNPPNFEETLAKQYSPAMARQELGGEFIEMDGAEWPAAWFPETMWFDRWPSANDITLRVIALDPSKGRGQDGDYSAFVVICRDKHGTLWVDADLSNSRPTTQIVADGIRLARRVESETGGAIDGFGCESDQFQELLAEQFILQTRAAGIQLPLYKVTTEGKPKDVRIRRLTSYLSTGLFRFRRSRSCELLVQQMREFPIGKHDDGPDSLEQGIRLAIRLWNGKVKGR